MKKTRTHLAVIAMVASMSLLAACSDADDSSAPMGGSAGTEAPAPAPTPDPAPAPAPAPSSGSAADVTPEPSTGEQLSSAASQAGDAASDAASAVGDAVKEGAAKADNAIQNSVGDGSPNPGVTPPADETAPKS
ncbi:hypothetical protein H0A65_02940 [Alcaligenaceae bacterium]|nr:hypothetical protein [Alcaligenaceae bacterium]